MLDDGYLLNIDQTLATSFMDDKKKIKLPALCGAALNALKELRITRILWKENSQCLNWASESYHRSNQHVPYVGGRLINTNDTDVSKKSIAVRRRVETPR